MAEIGTDIAIACKLLNQGNLVSIPTETVYGLAGNALNEDAILKIYAAKNRPSFDPLIAHTNLFDKVAPLVQNVPDTAHQLAKSFWPGPLTILLEKSDELPDLLTSGLSRVAIRIPRHPVTLELLQQLPFPLAAPSANPFGYVSPVTAEHVDAQLGDKIDYILDGGPCEVGLESTIVGFEGEEVIIYRLGGIGTEQIEAVVGKVEIKTNQSSNPAAPGMMKSHYAPRIKLILGNIEENLASHKDRRCGIISFQKDYSAVSGSNVILAPDGDLQTAARNLFGAIRQMDQSEVDLILAELVPDEGLGRAINDRLRRAAV